MFVKDIVSNRRRHVCPWCWRLLNIRIFPSTSSQYVQSIYVNQQFMIRLSELFSMRAGHYFKILVYLLMLTSLLFTENFHFSKTRGRLRKLLNPIQGIERVDLTFLPRWARFGHKLFDFYHHYDTRPLRKFWVSRSLLRISKLFGRGTLGIEVWGRWNPCIILLSMIGKVFFFLQNSISQ